MITPTVYTRTIGAKTLCVEVWPAGDDHRCAFRYSLMGDLFNAPTVLCEGGKLHPWHAVLPPGDEPTKVIKSYGECNHAALKSGVDKGPAIHWDALLRDVACRYKREVLEGELAWLREGLGCNAVLADKAVIIAMRESNAYLRTQKLVAEVDRWRGLANARYRLAVESYDAKGKRWIRLLHTCAVVKALRDCGKGWHEQPVLAQVRAEAAQRRTA